MEQQKKLEQDYFQSEDKFLEALIQQKESMILPYEVRKSLQIYLLVKKPFLIDSQNHQYATKNSLRVHIRHHTVNDARYEARHQLSEQLQQHILRQECKLTRNEL